ncbi:zinc finger protein [Plasmodium cynomolgi strain B]|uniref:Palmitoyltransferase n=1 Tax=Plasmodium cynomolgi (strain B) TaxID=1120755 RepID=K6UYD7_PLACD|nr:zinc finger protein [Plasmodium cynomolgi strain B]GAB68889.1 zinc finger protein [Plasmodium cynomolgi strain B]
MKIFKRNKTLEKANFDKINNVQIYGENKIHCKGFFVSGPAFLTVISSFLMILIPVAIFHAFTSTWLFEKDIYYVPFLNLFFFTLTIYTFFKTSFMDPGIIPRQVMATKLKSVLNIYDVIIQQYRETQPPRQKEVLINGNFYKLKYCYTCNIYRGIRTVHCSICDNCVEKVGNCIGTRNYKYFVYFVFNLYILICITLGASIYKLTICINNLSDQGYNTEKIFIHIWRMATDSIILIIYTILTLWFVIGLLCYHIYTIVTNQTTYEQIKTFYQNDNPFNIGVFNNIKEILFTKTRPSYINFVNPQLQVVDKKCSHHVVVLNDVAINIEEEKNDSKWTKKGRDYHSNNIHDSKCRNKNYNVKKKIKKEKRKNSAGKNGLRKKDAHDGDSLAPLGHSKQIRRKQINYETKINCFSNLTHVRKKLEYPILYKKKFPFIRKFKSKVETYYVVRYANINKNDFSTYCQQTSADLEMNSVKQMSKMKMIKKINYLRKLFSRKRQHGNSGHNNRGKIKMFSTAKSASRKDEACNCSRWRGGHVKNGHDDCSANAQANEKIVLKKRKKKKMMALQKDVIISIYNYKPKEEREKPNQWGASPSKLGKNEQHEKEQAGQVDQTGDHERSSGEEEAQDLSEQTHRQIHGDASTKHAEEKQKKLDLKLPAYYLSGIDNVELENFSKICEMRYTKMYKWKYKKMHKRILRRERIKLLSRPHKNIHLYYNNKNYCIDESTDWHKNSELLSEYMDANLYFARIKKGNKFDNLKLFNYLIHKHKQEKDRSDNKKKSKASKFFYFFTSFALIINCIHIPSSNDND